MNTNIKGDELLAIIRYHCDVILHATSNFGINESKIPALLETTKRIRELSIKFTKVAKNERDN